MLYLDSLFKSNMAGKDLLIKAIENLKINFKIITHPEVFTVEAMMPYLNEVDGLVCKNLFVKDKKKKQLWLVTTKHDQKVSLSWLSKHMKLGSMRFAAEDVLKEKLNVAKGCVTPLALFFDKECEVNFILDQSLTLNTDTFIYSHPMVNDASIGMAYSDLKLFIESTQHKINVVDFTDCN